MKRLLIAVVVLCLSCATVPRPIPDRDFTVRYLGPPLSGDPLINFHVGRQWVEVVWWNGYQVVADTVLCPETDPRVREYLKRRYSADRYAELSKYLESR